MNQPSDEQEAAHRLGWEPRVAERVWVLVETDAAGNCEWIEATVVAPNANLIGGSQYKWLVRLDWCPFDSNVQWYALSQLRPVL